jgi:Peptidase family S41
MAKNDNLQIQNGQLTMRVPPAPRFAFLDIAAGDSPPAALAQAAQPIEPTLGREDRLLIVEQALAMLEMSYIHLPQKRAMYAVDPVQRLRLLSYRIEQMSDEQLPDDRLFHNEMIEIFNQVRDLHTNYILPAPNRFNTAYLPFLLEEYYEGQVSHFIVTRLDPDPKIEHDPSFEEGVEVLYWNGVPIKRAVEMNAARQAGGNPDARYQRGLSALTIRPLSRILPPEEEWVRLRYRALNGKEHDTEYTWVVSTHVPSKLAEEEAKGTGEALAFGFDLQWAQTQEVRRELYASTKARQMDDVLASERLALIAGDSELKYESALPQIFRARPQKTGAGTFGYMRIFSFMHEQADIFVAEFKRLMDLLPKGGLIIDVRNNGGGSILASERLLQLLTSEPVEPARFQFINSPLTLALSRRYEDLKIWKPSITQSVETGAIESLAFPVTSKESLERIKEDYPQAYPGPIVLITDALCYSATDIFAAGFQDHKIGKILGASGNTGAGGANVWTHSDLCVLVSELDDSSPLREVFKPLPLGIEMRVAMRRCLRVRDNAGIPVEDLGVVPDQVHRMTKRDLLESNKDLLNTAGAMLKKMKKQQG